MYLHHPFPTVRRILTSFAHAHDDVPAFHAAFLVGTFLAATLFNLGFFALLIFFHVLLDIIKYRDLQRCSVATTCKAAFFESIFDFTLLSIALASSVYLHHSFALALLSGLSRAELTVARALATILPKMQIFEHTLHLVAHVNAYLRTPHPALRTGITRGQRLSLLFLAGSVVLLVLSPFFFSASGQTALLKEIMHEELVPWIL